MAGLLPLCGHCAALECTPKSPIRPSSLVRDPNERRGLEQRFSCVACSAKWSWIDGWGWRLIEFGKEESPGK